MVDYHFPEIPHVWPLPRLKGLNFSNVPTLPSTSNKSSECSCCSRNKPAKIQRMLHHVLWINFMQKETKLFTLHHSLEMQPFRKWCFTDISKISLNFLRKSVAETWQLPSRPRCTSNPSYLWLAVLLDPAENAGRQLLKAAHWHRVAEGLEEGVHDALKDVELQLVRHLVLSLLRVVLVGPHNVLVVAAERRQSVFSHSDYRVAGNIHIMLAMVFIKTTSAKTWT